MVWFHGGASAFGNANAPTPRGCRLAARNDVVVVSVNQRLNIFGHLDLSEFGGADYRLLGNAGTLDMIAAPNGCGTITPGSAAIQAASRSLASQRGGGKVSTLLAMPRAAGPFQRVIIESGAAIRLRTRDRALA
jgi:para-nitrobenzyl esterase